MMPWPTAYVCILSSSSHRTWGWHVVATLAADRATESAGVWEEGRRKGPYFVVSYNEHRLKGGYTTPRNYEWGIISTATTFGWQTHFSPISFFAGADWPVDYPEGQCGGQEQSPIALSSEGADFSQFDVDIQQAESGVEGHIGNVGGEYAWGLVSRECESMLVGMLNAFARVVLLYYTSACRTWPPLLPRCIVGYRGWVIKVMDVERYLTLDVGSRLILEV